MNPVGIVLCAAVADRERRGARTPPGREAIGPEGKRRNEASGERAQSSDRPVRPPA
jgi:hypothetical protein